jgi:NMD protein affecting ribosome stability and mRNA decay
MKGQRMIVCPGCGEEKKHCARGLCQKCYDRERLYGDISKYPMVGCKRPSKRISAPCPKCGTVAPLTIVNGLCEKCYHSEQKKKNIVVCSRCGQSRPHDSHGLCPSCSSTLRIKTSRYQSPAITCAICGEQKPQHAKGLCSRCYRREHKRTWKKKVIICNKCGQTKEHMAHGLCENCYFTLGISREPRLRREETRRNLPATLTQKEWNDILEKYNYSCAYCGCNDKPLAQEHWIPSSRGGGYTADNIVPSCTHCNSRKRSMTGDEFLEFLNKENAYASTHDTAS